MWRRRCAGPARPDRCIRANAEGVDAVRPASAASICHAKKRTPLTKFPEESGVSGAAGPLGPFADWTTRGRTGSTLSLSTGVSRG